MKITNAVNRALIAPAAANRYTYIYFPMNKKKWRRNFLLILCLPQFFTILYLIFWCGITGRYFNAGCEIVEKRFECWWSPLMFDFIVLLTVGTSLLLWVFLFVGTILYLRIYRMELEKWFLSIVFLSLLVIPFIMMVNPCHYWGRLIQY